MQTKLSDKIITQRHRSALTVTDQARSSGRTAKSPEAPIPPQPRKPAGIAVTCIFGVYITQGGYRYVPKDFAKYMIRDLKEDDGLAKEMFG